ncbi:hypothetical protein Bca4012_065365 [Brassica carinata]
MSKRSASSVPLSADGAKSRMRVDSPASWSDSSSDPSAETDCDLLTPLPLTYARTAPPSKSGLLSMLRGRSPFTRLSSRLASEGWSRRSLFDYRRRGVFISSSSQWHADCGGEGRLYLRPRSGMPIVEEIPKAERKGPAFNKKWAERYAFMSLPGSTYQWNIIVGTHPTPSERENTVVRARQLPLDRRQVDVLVGTMSGSAADDSFAAYQESAKGRRTRGGVMTRAYHQSAEIGRSVGILATALSNLNISVFPRDGNVLLVGDTSEVIQTVSQLFHLGERLSTEDVSSAREELEALKHEASVEKDHRMARELEIRDLMEKVDRP